ncbi:MULTISPECIES: ABC transporter permease [unclassified Microbacterium]|uniref:ABC transporter permease n=1 Tax=unclassified Microbacterium TaxID=2609290 RepID=UPI00097F05D5|nr:ABC transporter permease [Microbacterium sp. JB110]RCS60132.1 ABC transporter permease [Microbacterium sp. JB110]SJM47652.1 Inositol transport system permease protein [Frigoribacterium sp. JB110]
MSTDTAVEKRRAFSAKWLQDMAIRYAMVLVLIVVIAFFAYRSARFATPDNVVTILIAAAPFALIALGQTLVILTGGIDLSVGSVIALSAMAGAYAAKAMPDQLFLALAVAILVGAVAGAVNGFVVSVLDVPPFIATLGMLTLASGLAYVIGGGAPINGLPQNFSQFANTEILGLTIPVILMIIGIVGFGIMMRRTKFGMHVYAVGGNEQASRIAGIKTGRVKFLVYTISGALAGVSGIMLASRTINGSPSLGVGYELDAIAAVVIGGASLMGGRGTIWGTALGLLMIQTLNNGLDILTVPAYWQDVVKGLLIVAAVSVDVWAAKRRS